MFHMQKELVESIQQDRHREAEAARFNTQPSIRRTLRQLLAGAPSTIINSMRGTRTAMPPAST